MEPGRKEASEGCVDPSEGLWGWDCGNVSTLPSRGRGQGCVSTEPILHGCVHPRSSTCCGEAQPSRQAPWEEGVWVGHQQHLPCDLWAALPLPGETLPPASLPLDCSVDSDRQGALWDLCAP